ncbi:ABC transporter permease [Cytophagales bacterium LB-30]|uniref:ABC transporter permease n=1 Tax=Shiella aurantiaca TaxID=3058365 RepID=A0ABT8F421_9BACT|nr:ABC transporter permease [Shiella aurantiaca]MDN4165048.1 ABC transporter permease [Shiella aurantiaca]
MIKNYFKIALRNLLKNRIYSFINIFGLAVGLACSILIFLWVADEYSYDRFHSNIDNIYRLHASQTWVQGIGTSSSMPYPLKDALKEKSSQIEHVAMTNWGEGNMLEVGDKRLNRFGLSATEDFFKIFSFQMLAGDSATALKEPYSIVITEETAELFFPNEEAIGKRIKIDHKDELIVTGVIKNLPRQSSFSFDYVLPFGYYEASQSWARNSRDNWDDNSFQMYVALKEGASEEEVNSQIKHLIRDNNEKAPTSTLFLHPMSKWRLQGNFENGVNTGGLLEYVQLFTAVAIFVLIIACINFMNLSTARSESRAREVGIRKSIGSSRRNIVYQFLGESIITTFLATSLSLVLVELTLPYYNALLNKQISIDYSSPLNWALAAGVVLIVGLFSGSYPAFYLSGFKPITVLKGKVRVGVGALLPRKVLVIMQFSFSVFLIIGSLVIYKQITHLKNRDIGYDKENLMLIWTNNEIEREFQTLRTALEQTGVVESVAKSNSPITSIFSNREVSWPGKTSPERVAFSTIATEYDYTKTMGIKIKEGRDFSPEFNDTTSTLVNETAIKMMGMEDPIGQKITFNGRYELTIVGVMEDVVMGQPHLPVEPLVMIFSPDWSSTISIRLSKTENLGASIDKIEAVFKKVNPNYPFEFRFADRDFNAKFSTIDFIGKLAAVFAIIAILISCLGLLGLAAFTAEQRTKEVGIRKVLGASAADIVLLISRDFSVLVLLGFLISSPVAWWYLNSFLERYPYRISIMWWIVPVVGITVLLLALAIVSSQALRAALANPVDSLKYE